MSTPNDVQGLHREVISMIKSHQGRHDAELKDQKGLIENIRTQLAEIRADAKRSTEIVGGGGDSPGGQVVTKHQDCIEAAKKYGKATIVLDRPFFPVGETKATITSTALGSSTPGILRPTREGDLVQLPRRRMTLRDLFGSRPADSNAVEFVRETALPTASPQVEASDKFQSDYTLEVASSAVQTFATWVAASRQALDDLPELQDWIDNSLLFALMKLEETEFLIGDGTGQHIDGLVTQATSYVGTYDRSGDSALDRLRNAITEQEAGDEQVDFIVLNPIDFRNRVQSLKEESNGSNTGRYIAADPVGGGLIATPTIWGVPAILTNSMAVGTFLIGDSRQVSVADRMQANVMISTEHNSYFVQNLVAIRAEERVALVVRRPGAFLTGSLTDTSPL